MLFVGRPAIHSYSWSFFISINSRISTLTKNLSNRRKLTTQCFFKILWMCSGGAKQHSIHVWRDLEEKLNWICRSWATSRYVENCAKNFHKATERCFCAKAMFVVTMFDWKQPWKSIIGMRILKFANISKIFVRWRFFVLRNILISESINNNAAPRNFFKSFQEKYSCLMTINLYTCSMNNSNEAVLYGLLAC